MIGPEPTTLAGVYRAAKNALANIGDTPDLDARLLIEHVYGIDALAIFTEPDRAINYETIKPLLDRRKKGEPISKITGTREFYGLPFIVTRDVLDPRADTETLIEAATRRMQDWEGDITILDLGTGSGCLLVTLLHLLPEATGIGIDASPAALEVAKLNAKKLGVEKRASFRLGNWLEDVTEGPFSCIVSNPPYIESHRIRELDENVRFFDPLEALDGGGDGLDPYKILFPQIRRNLAQGGHAWFEFGSEQEEAIVKLAESCGLTVHGVYRDLGNRPRIVEIS